MPYRVTRAPVSFVEAGCNACGTRWVGPGAAVDAELHTLNTGHTTVTESTLSDTLNRCTLSLESNPGAGPG